MIQLSMWGLSCMKKSAKNGNRYCKTCGQKLIKNGHDRNGNQRWKCQTCNTSKRLPEDRQKKEKIIRICLDWILTKLTAEQIGEKYGISRSTFYRWKQEFFKILPEFAITGEIYDSVIVDGKRIKGDMYLIARTPKFVIYGLWAPGETVEAYMVLFSMFPKPQVLVMDGNKSIESAANKIYVNPSIQRCFVHIYRYIKRQVGKHPTTPAKRAIANVAAQLFTVDTKEKSEKWEKSFRKQYDKYKNEIMEKRPLKNPGGKTKYYWVNKNLHYAWHHILYPLNKGYLWSYLAHPKGNVPRDTNCLEGGVNSNLKQLNYVHRGMKKDDEQKMLQWDLLRKSEFGINGFLEDYFSDIKSTQFGT